MISIETAKRLIKRVILSNVVCTKPNLALTPLVSGKHGIGKSAMIKSIADEIGGVCITIEGGTLKEGEITGLPYQYKDDNGKIKFRFLPYYAIERVQNEEKRLFELANETKQNFNTLFGDENAYAQNDLSPQEKLEALKNKKVTPVIIFIDEINRTENSVYKELMNILLTRSVNGYKFPWWVFFVGAMNPSTQNSIYSTNEMDPAQLDRFLKIKVEDDSAEWLKFAKNSGIGENIINFIKSNPKCLSSNSKELEDEEKPEPSPRGWDMVDTILKAEPMLQDFFTEEENKPKIVEKDLKMLVSAKLGSTIATMFFASLVSQAKLLMPEEFFTDDENLSKTTETLKMMPIATKVQLCDLLANYLKDNIEFMMLSSSEFEKNKKQLCKFIEMLDSSTKLLFAQKLVSATTDSGNSLIEFMFDVFEKDLISMLDLSEKTREQIEKSK